MHTAEDTQGLSEAQQSAIVHAGSPLLVLAGAGSGKTRVLTYRIAHILRQRGVSPARIFAVTFTNKAAAEMRGRVERILGARAPSMWLGTFHSMCAKLLRIYGDRLGLSRDYTIFDDRDSMTLVRECMAALHIREQMYPARAIAGCIDTAKNGGLSPAQYARLPHDFTGEKAALVYPAYQKSLAKQNALDFGDLILRAIELFAPGTPGSDDLAARFEHVLVDEFQDTNTAQYRLLRMLSRGGAEVCVVGDDDQSIYGWRGAEIQNILGFGRDFAGTRIIHLGQNYRSTGAIVRAAARAVGHNQHRHEKRIFTENTEGEPPRYVRFDDERSEAQHIAAEIERLGFEEGTALRDIAVFFRTNAASRVFEDALRQHGISHVVVGGVRFYERKEVRDILGYLRLIANPKSDVDFRRVVNVPARGLGDVTQGRIAEHAGARGLSLYEAAREMAEAEVLAPKTARALREFVELIARLSKEAEARRVGDLCRRVLEETGYRRTLLEERTVEARARLENIEELVSAAEELEEEVEGATLVDFLAGTALVSDTDDLKGGDAVSLMTLHSAKGLEFNVVFLTGLEQGMLPHKRSLEEGNLEEERRLLYVGITRARKTLWLSSACVRRVFGELKALPESRFVAELGDTIACENRADEAIFDDAEPVLFFSRARPSPSRDARASGASRPPPLGFSRSPRPPRPSHDELDQRAHADDDAPLGARKGMRVSHALFGEGRVESIEGAGSGQKLSVRFEDGEVRRIVAKYVRLLGY
jgi:DNA helicase-2/ATP-dependent DNA helicase PcrA